MGEYDVPERFIKDVEEEHMPANGSNCSCCFEFRIGDAAVFPSDEERASVEAAARQLEAERLEAERREAEQSSTRFVEPEEAEDE